MFKKLLLNLFRIIIKFTYYVFFVFIPKKNIIIGGYKARFLSGNNLYLFNFLNSQNLNSNYFFYTKSKKTYKLLKKKYPRKILYAYNLTTILKLFQAKILIITTGTDDFSPYPLLKKAIIINLWHGIPIKKIGSTENFSDTKLSRNIDYFSVSSEFEATIMKTVFNLPDNKIFISGLAKNDYIKYRFKFFLSKNPYLKRTVIIYAPTFREKSQKTKSLSDIFPIQKLQNLLEKYNAVFLYRNHFNSSEQKISKQYNRILSAPPSIFQDVQPLLFFSDILITDYSGIYFDYLLLNRPIIFYNYDYEEYEKSRGFLFDYYKNTPGEKVQTKERIVNVIEDYLIDSDKDKEFREIITKKFHKYRDGKNSERIYELIKKLL